MKLIRSVTVSQSIGFYEPMVEQLQKKGFEIVSVSSDGPELAKLQDKGVKTIVVDMYRRLSPFKDLVSLWKLIKVFRKEKPDIVHSMTPKAGMLSMLAGWITRVPRRVHTFTGLVWPTSTGFKRKLLMFTDWITCACATHIIPEGNGVKSDLQNHITKKPMKVLGYGNVMGVDMDFWKKKDTTELDHSKFNFVFVGRIVKDKGINELVAAFKKFNEKYPDTHLWLIGPYEDDIDPVEASTREIIANNNAIEALGRKNRDELVEYYSASDCFIFPSYREGFPNTVLEAGAMGLPSIVTDINGSRDIIEDGKNGVIVPSKDVDALYNAMERLFTDKALRESLAKNARPMIESRFERGFVRQCLMDFYDEILKN